jgi:predicted membrane protein
MLGVEAMTREEALRAMRNGAYAAFIFAIYALMLIYLNGFSIYSFIVFYLALGFGCGVLRQSRVAAIILSVVCLLGVLLGTIVNAVIHLIFLYFFVKAIKGAVTYHKIEKAANPESFDDVQNF